MIHVMTREEMREYARRAVAAMPPLTPQQRDDLWILLAPMRKAIAARVAARAAEAKESETEDEP